jgi:hypothetical protein
MAVARPTQHREKYNVVQYPGSRHSRLSFYQNRRQDAIAGLWRNRGPDDTTLDLGLHDVYIHMFSYI